MSWALAILGIIVLILLHELGHFVVAKWVGMRVERFSLFFPPTLWRVRRGETEYAIGAIPAGGYVKITGMNPEELAGLEPEVARRAYYAQPPWKRIVVILAGPAVNLVIAFVVFWAVLASASYNGELTLAELNPSIPTLTATTAVQAVTRGGPAARVLRAGDRILAVDGERASVPAIERAINKHRCVGAARAGCRASSAALVTIERGGRVQNVAVVPHYSADAGRMLIGFEFATRGKHFGVLAGAGVAAHEMWSTTTHLVTSIGRAFTSAKVRHQFHSVVGITEIAQESVAAGAGYALVFLSFISLVLAIINLFPFLPLDGGHVLWSVVEKLRGRPVSMAAMYRFSSVGIILMLFLVINGVSNDIGRLGG